MICFRVAQFAECISQTRPLVHCTKYARDQWKSKFVDLRKIQKLK